MHGMGVSCSKYEDYSQICAFWTIPSNSDWSLVHLAYLHGPHCTVGRYRGQTVFMGPIAQ